MAAAAKLQLLEIRVPNAMTLPSFCVSNAIQCAECNNVTNSRRRRLTVVRTRNAMTIPKKGYIPLHEVQKANVKETRENKVAKE